MENKNLLVRLVRRNIYNGRVERNEPVDSIVHCLHERAKPQRKNMIMEFWGVNNVKIVFLCCTPCRQNRLKDTENDIHFYLQYPPNRP